MNVIDARSVAGHVVLNLAVAQSRGRTCGLEELATEIGVRRADVRNVVSRLHAEGHVDALRMRLTMSGLAVAASLSNCKLREPRTATAHAMNDSYVNVA